MDWTLLASGYNLERSHLDGNLMTKVLSKGDQPNSRHPFRRICMSDRLCPFCNGCGTFAHPHHRNSFSTQVVWNYATHWVLWNRPAFPVDVCRWEWPLQWLASQCRFSLRTNTCRNRSTRLFVWWASTWMFAARFAYWLSCIWTSSRHRYCSSIVIDYEKFVKKCANDQKKKRKNLFKEKLKWPTVQVYAHIQCINLLSTFKYFARYTGTRQEKDKGQRSNQREWHQYTNKKTTINQSFFSNGYHSDLICLVEKRLACLYVIASDILEKPGK